MIPSSDFTTVTVTDFPGVFGRCNNCKEVVEESCQADHKCPPAASEVVFAQEEADVATAFKEVEAAVGVEAVKSAIHRYDGVCKIVWENRVRRTEQKFPPDILRKIAYKEMEFLLRRVREMRDGEYTRNDELRAKGVSFVDRMQQVNPRKIDWCEKEEVRITAMMRSFGVRPFREWFDEVDYLTARKNGMGYVMRFKLEWIIT